MADTDDDSALRRIIASATGRDVSALRPSDSLRQVLGLDTVDLIRIVVAAETVYGVECDAERLNRIDSYGDLLAALRVGDQRARSAA